MNKKLEGIVVVKVKRLGGIIITIDDEQFFLVIEGFSMILLL